jgi:hypothetical protein
MAKLDTMERRMCRPGLRKIATGECPERPTYHAVVKDGDETVVIRVYRGETKAQEDERTVPAARRFPDDESAILAMRGLNDMLIEGAL